MKKPGTVNIGRLRISASRFPWQGYGWRPHKNGKGPTAPLNPMGSRFGAGWNYKLGFALSNRTLMLDLLIGTVSFYIEPKKRDQP